MSFKDDNLEAFDVRFTPSRYLSAEMYANYRQAIKITLKS